MKNPDSPSGFLFCFNAIRSRLSRSSDLGSDGTSLLVRSWIGRYISPYCPISDRTLHLALLSDLGSDATSRPVVRSRIGRYVSPCCPISDRTLRLTLLSDLGSDATSHPVVRSRIGRYVSPYCPISDRTIQLRYFLLHYFLLHYFPLFLISSISAIRNSYFSLSSGLLAASVLYALIASSYHPCFT